MQTNGRVYIYGDDNECILVILKVDRTLLLEVESNSFPVELVNNTDFFENGASLEDRTSFRSNEKSIEEYLNSIFTNEISLRFVWGDPDTGISSLPPVPPETTHREMRRVIGKKMEMDYEMQEQYDSYFLKVNPQEGFYLVDIMYATDREAVEAGSSRTKIYTSNRGNNLVYGNAKVSVPKKRKPGTMPHPFSFLGLSFPEDPTKHMVITEHNRLSYNDFILSVKQQIQSDDKKSALLFIHGYNTTFENAVRRTAQIKFDVSFSGLAFTYSWPSQGRVLDYPSDEAAIHFTETNLKRFLNELLTDTGINQLHIIAHSMGNRAITEVLKELSIANNFPAQINEVILAAPDVDSGVFQNQIVPALKDKTNVTLYASQNDKALQVSMRIRSGYSRAGLAGNNLIVMNGIETIDASNVRTDLIGHGYFAETKSLLDDLSYLIKHKLRANARNLISNIKNGVQYWNIN